MKRMLRKGLSLPEVIGVFAMIGVLCVALTPHLLQVRTASRLSKLRFNLEKLRQKIDDFRTRNGRPPGTLAEVNAERGEAIPENPFSAAPVAGRSRVKRIDSDPPLPRDITPSAMGGWLYNPETGGVWPDHVQYLSE